MNFSGKETEGLGVSRPVLEGNKIHTVKFDGIEAVDMKNGELHNLRIKFSNDDGYFNHTIFEPQPGDDQDTEGAFGPNPSRVKTMMTLLRHLGAAVCPDLITAINSFDEKTTWEQIRKKVIEVTTPAIGTETKIKLLKRQRTNVNTGELETEVQFPGFFLSYNREGKLYMKTNFIGKGIYFSDKELTAIKKQETAQPVTMKSGNTDEFEVPAAVAAAADDDFDDTNF